MTTGPGRRARPSTTSPVSPARRSTWPCARRLRWRPLPAGLATAASLSLVLDETITPAIGASAPNPAYPASTHVRAFLAHLGYGLAVAGAAEAAWAVLRRRR